MKISSDNETYHEDLDFLLLPPMTAEKVQSVIDKYDFGERTLIYPEYQAECEEEAYFSLFLPLNPRYGFGVAKFLSEILGCKVEWDHEEYELTPEQLALEKTAKPVRFPLKKKLAKTN